MPTTPLTATGQAGVHWIDVLIIVGYLATLIVVGFIHARRQRTLNEYFLADQNVRWLVLGISLVAALNSGLDYLMQPSAMIKFGAAVLAANLTWLVLLPYVFAITLPLYRRLGAVSAYEYLERRFDGKIRLLAASIFLLWRTGWLATALYVPALAINTASGDAVPISPCILVVGSVVTTYTMLGGIRAVIWNNVLQCGIMFLGLAATIAVVIAQTDGGVRTILNELTVVGDAQQLVPPIGSPQGPLSYFFIPMTAGGMFVAVLVARLTTYTCDQVMVQRFQTSQSVQDAKRGFVLNAVSDVVWMVCLCFVGLALSVYLKSQFGELPQWTESHPDRVFPYFMANALPVGLTGLVVAAILAASLSSISSAINSISAIIVVDFLQRFSGVTSGLERPSVDSESRQILATRLITVAVGLLGIIAATQVSRLGSLLEISNKIINSFTGPLLGIYLLGMFTQRASSRGVLFGGVLGSATTVAIAFQAELYALLQPFFGSNDHPVAIVSFLWPSTFGLAVTLIIGYLSSLAAPARDVAGASWMWRKVIYSQNAK